MVSSENIMGEWNNQACFNKLSYFPVTSLLFFNSLVQRGDRKLREAEFHAAIGTTVFSVWQGIQDFFEFVFKSLMTW